MASGDGGSDESVKVSVALSAVWATVLSTKDVVEAGAGVALVSELKPVEIPVIEVVGEAGFPQARFARIWARFFEAEPMNRTKGPKDRRMNRKKPKKMNQKNQKSENPR